MCVQTGGSQVGGPVRPYLSMHGTAGGTDRWVPAWGQLVSCIAAPAGTQNAGTTGWAVGCGKKEYRPRNVPFPGSVTYFSKSSSSFR